MLRLSSSFTSYYVKQYDFFQFVDFPFVHTTFFMCISYNVFHFYVMGSITKNAIFLSIKYKNCYAMTHNKFTATTLVNVNVFTPSGHLTFKGIQMIVSGNEETLKCATVSQLKKKFFMNDIFKNVFKTLKKILTKIFSWKKKYFSLSEADCNKH